MGYGGRNNRHIHNLGKLNQQLGSVRREVESWKGTHVCPSHNLLQNLLQQACPSVSLELWGENAVSLLFILMQSSIFEVAPATEL